MQWQRYPWGSMFSLLIVGAIWCAAPASLAAVLRPYDPPTVSTPTPTPQQQVPWSRPTPDTQGSFFTEFANKVRHLSAPERDKLRESLQRGLSRAQQRRDRESTNYYTNLLNLLDAQ